MFFKNNIKGSIKSLLLVVVFLFVILFCSVSEIRLDKQDNFAKGLPVLQEISLNETEIPEGLANIEIDTLLTNDFRVNIHNWTNTERIYHLENKAGTYVKNKYKGFSSDLRIYYKSQLVFDQRLSKGFFENPEESAFWNNAILQTVEVDELKSIEQPLIHIRFYNPVQEEFKAYQIKVDHLGEYDLQFISGTNLS